MYSPVPFGLWLLIAVCSYQRMIASIELQMEYLVSLCPEPLLHIFDGSVIERWVKVVGRMNSCVMREPVKNTGVPVDAVRTRGIKCKLMKENQFLNFETSIDIFIWLHRKHFQCKKNTWCILLPL